MKKFLLSTLAALGFAGMAFAGSGTQADPFTVAEIQAGNPTGTEVWVKGYIVGSVDGAALEAGAHFSTEKPSNTNILLADTQAENDIHYAIPVGLATSVRSALSLQSNPNNLGHQVIVKGSYETYFSVKGIKSVSDYEWIGEAPAQPEPPEGATFPTTVMTVAECLNLMAQGATGEGSVKGYISKIDEVSLQYGNATYYLVDDLAVTTPSLEVFRGYYLDGAKFTDASQLQVGAFVIVKGDLVNYNGTYEFTTGSKIVEYTSPSGEIPTPSVPEGENVTFDFTNPAGLGISVGDATEYDLTGVELKNGNVSIAFNSSSSASTKIRLFASGGNWTMRFYKDTDFTVSVPEGYYLTGIVFDGTNLGTDWSYSNGNLNGSTWTPSSTTNTVTIGKTKTGSNPTIKTMAIYYTNDAGVEEIAIADDSQAVYFNLQGQKIANPDRGIFIKVVNGKAVKVMK